MRETIPAVPDMSVSGLDIQSVATAIWNMRKPAKVETVSLGRWKKSTEELQLKSKYT